jgi:HAD superfamily hydrolase (TIGR01509 family)
MIWALMQNAPDTTRLPRAVLFDMDGTLTRPMLDFPRIKAEMGIGSRPILEALAEMGEARRAAAEAILLRHEEEAALGSTLNAGCTDLLEWLNGRGVRSAVITRNSRSSVATVFARHGLTFDVVIAREDAAPKPDPRPLLLACERLCVTPGDAWMVGDGQYDIEAGLAAGVRTVWVSHGLSPPFAARPWRTVRDLAEFQALLAQDVP